MNRLTRACAAMIAFAFLGNAALAQDAALPPKAPIPKERQPGADNAQSQEALPPGSKVPIPGEPETRPAEAAPPKPDALPSGAEAPLPENRPAETDIRQKVSTPKASVGRHNAYKTYKPPVPDKTAITEDAACRERLKQLDVTFDARPAISDPLGCSVPFPISVSALGDVSVEPPAVMNCAMTEALANFTRTTISPTAKALYGADLKALASASAYVCRPRNGTSKLSEHAFGNAFDIARFVLTDGTAIDVGPVADDKGTKFLGEIRKAACGPFKTVLGPGSDADHATHFHLDLAPRRNGGTFCQ
jgi:hypothetical protein